MGIVTVEDCLEEHMYPKLFDENEQAENIEHGGGFLPENLELDFFKRKR